MGRFQRSWALTRYSFQVLRSDKELLVFPLVASVAAILVGVRHLRPARPLIWWCFAAGQLQPGIDRQRQREDHLR